MKKAIWNKVRRVKARLNKAGSAYNSDRTSAVEKARLLRYGNKMMAYGARLQKRVWPAETASGSGG